MVDEAKFEFGLLESHYRGVNKSVYVLLSRTQAGPGRTVKKEQEEISRNHVPTFIYLSVCNCNWLVSENDLN